MMSDVLTRGQTLTALIFSAAIPYTCPADSTIRPRWAIGVGLGIFMILRTMSPRAVGVSIISRFNASSTHSMTGTRNDISVSFCVFMVSRAMGDFRFPTQTVVNHVCRILTRSTPVQIRYVVVVGVVVAMKPPQFIGTNTNKGFQNKYMYHYLFRLPIFIQSASAISSTRSSGQYLRKDSSLEHPWSSPSASALTIQRSYAAMIRYFIIRILGYRQPFFITSHSYSLTLLGKVR